MFRRRSGRPTDREAAGRLLILRQVALVGVALPTPDQVKEDTEGMSPAEIGEYRAMIEGNWADTWRELDRLDLTNAMSRRERVLAATSPWDLTLQQRIDASWRVEAVSTLLWSFGALESLSAYDETTPHDVLDAVPIDRGSAFLAQARLRPQAEIAAAREAAELWHWRSRTRTLMSEKDDPGLAGHTWDSLISSAADAAVGLGMFNAPLASDFPAFGQAYRDLSDEEWATITSVTAERHLTLNWLSGFAQGNDWDATPTDS